MGYMRHYAIIVTSHSAICASAAHLKATELFNALEFDCSDSGMVTNMVVTPTNGYASFMVGTDGSKLGWDDSLRADKARSEFIEYLSDNWSDSCDYVYVQYGDDDKETKILESSD